MSDNNKENENSENKAPENNTDKAPKVDVISSVDQVEPWTDVKLYEHAIKLLHINTKEDNRDFVYTKDLYTRHFGENYTEENYNADISDERQQAVASEYIRDRLDYVKNMSTSLNSEKINDAFENIFSLVGMNITVANEVENAYDEIFTKRAGQNEFLLEDYEVLKINRQVFHIYNERKNITELSRLITTMEDLAISIEDNKDEPDFKIVDNETLAQFYYNVSEIYENEANHKSNMPDVNKWHYRAMEYKKKALDMTSSNIVMVSNIQNDWSAYPGYNHEKIIDACERVIDNDAASDRDKYRAHKLCADTLFKLQVVDGFVGGKGRTDDIINHYSAALVYTHHAEDKIDILNSISKVQKKAYPDDYIDTRYEIAKMLEGRPRIREHFKLASVAQKTDFKIALLKSCINEFHELPNIDTEDRLLFDHIDRKLRDILPDSDRETIKILDKLKNKYGSKDNKNNKLLFPTMSSKGYDYFCK